MSLTSMPPKRDASKASKAAKADGDKPAATGRATRGAKKREQDDLAAEGRHSSLNIEI